MEQIKKQRKPRCNIGLELYKKRYIIALYDKNDWCCGVFDNLSQISSTFKIPFNNLKWSLNKALKRNHLWLGYNVYLIDMLEELGEKDGTV